jgi:hypothetical protein
MTEEFLKALTESWAESYRQSTPDKKIEENVSFHPRYADFPTQRLAVIEMHIDGKAAGAGVFGLVGSELVRVVCLDRSGDSVHLDSGECGQNIVERFGVSFSK